MKPMLPWLVKERDFRRYLGRALDACESGRVVFFYHQPKRKKRQVLLALAPWHDWQKVLAAASASFNSGRYRKVVLEKLPSIKRTR